MKARLLLRFYKSFRTEFPNLDDQAALALYDAVANEQVGWTALLAWAGADPFRPVPWNFEDAFPADPERYAHLLTRIAPASLFAFDNCLHKSTARHRVFRGVKAAVLNPKTKYCR
jgi:hypothetical protein